MTHEDLQIFFAPAKYDPLRDDLRRLMSFRPEILDPYKLAAAAERIYECRTDGVELSLEDALRLAENAAAPDPRALADKIICNGAGVDLLDILTGAAPAPPPDVPEPDPDPDVKTRADKLAELAEIVAMNPDAILLARPDFFPGAEFVMVSLAFLGGELSPEEKKALREMRALADESELRPDPGFVRAVFRLRLSAS